MKKETRWVVIDTETDGLYEPIHVVELCGQMMEGWQPVGEPFRMLLNHDVPIPPEAVAIHGYTQEYLRKHGQEPVCVYTAFGDYARDYPLVAHNLSYDWNRCLEPEWARLGVPQIGQRGCCCMMLARRLVREATNCRLEALKACFHLTPTRSHQAKNDVLTVVELFQRVYRPRLESAGLETFDSVSAFAKRTPVARCLDIIRGGPKLTAPPPQPKDEWYSLDAGSNAHGPLPARVMFLNSWLQDFGFTAEWPASEIAQTVERILEDGVVTKEEKEELKRLIQGITAACGTLTTQLRRHDPPESCPVLTAPQSSEHYTIFRSSFKRGVSNLETLTRIDQG